MRTRESLLTAMITTAAHLGYADSSVAKVIKEAGVARSTFYEHFSDKDECFNTALDQVAEGVLARVEGATADAEPRVAGVRLLAALVDFAVEDRAGAQLLFIESLAAGERALGLRDQLCDQTANLVEAIWSEIPAGAPRLDVDPDALVGAVFRLLSMRLRHGESGTEGIIEELPCWANSYAVKGELRWPMLAEPESEERELAAAPLLAPERLARGRHRMSRAEVALDQRRRILRATAALSWEKGYSVITVAEITTAARVSRKAFYTHFRDKQQAASEANEAFFGGAMAACAAAFFAAQSWPERAWAGAQALAQFIATDPQGAYLGFVEPHAIGATAIQQSYDRLAAFTLFAEEGYNQRSEAKGLPKICSEALAAMMFEVNYRQLRQRRGAEALLAVMPQLVYACLAPFMGPEAAGEFVEGKVEEES